MPTGVFYQPFIERLAEGEIDLQNDSFKVALSNTTPDVTDDDLADVTEISAGNGYTAGGTAITVASSGQSSGTYTLAFDDLNPAFTASGGSIGPFRYLILYDDTHASDALIMYFDYGSETTLASGDSLAFNFDAATITIAPA